MVSVGSIDTVNNRVITNLGYVSYDYLVIATGSSTNFYGAENIENNSIGLKNINDAINLRSWILQSLEYAIDGSSEEEKQKLTKFVIVGGGPAGVELAGALAEFKKYLLRNDYPEIDSSLMKIYLVQAGNRILPAMSERSSKHALKILSDLDVDVMLNTRVKDYDGQTLLIETKNGKEELLAGILIWTAGVKGNAPKGIDPGLLSGGNRIQVNKYNQVHGLDNVFAIGDIALMQATGYPKGHPMVAQVAIQQARNLGKNLLSLQKSGKMATKFIYNDKGSMAIIGKKDAVADIKNVFLDGRIGWLVWSMIHLITLTGFKNKIAVAINWAVKYFTYEKANQIIIRRYVPGIQKSSVSQAKDDILIPV
jgi:NADH dehydrogenase